MRRKELRSMPCTVAEELVAEPLESSKTRLSSGRSTAFCQERLLAANIQVSAVTRSSLTHETSVGNSTGPYGVWSMPHTINAASGEAEAMALSSDSAAWKKCKGKSTTRKKRDSDDAFMKAEGTSRRSLTHYQRVRCSPSACVPHAGCGS